ncbi:MAG: copper resistance protein [Rhodopseudomonas sp.]|nr:copper resistance protein [Rhodopseudomonas sp.]
MISRYQQTRMTLFSYFTALAVMAAATGAAHAHDGHFSAGQPGDPKKPSHAVKVVMHEDGRNMLFTPSHLTVRKGEQIRFILNNDGTEKHEFVLATVEENRKHGALMKRFPNMEHADPNARQLMPYTGGEILWKFTKAGTFEFACLIPGHYEAGMHGTITVK